MRIFGHAFSCKGLSTLMIVSLLLPAISSAGQKPSQTCEGYLRVLQSVYSAEEAKKNHAIAHDAALGAVAVLSPWTLAALLSDGGRHALRWGLDAKLFRAGLVAGGFALVKIGLDVVALAIPTDVNSSAAEDIRGNGFIGHELALLSLYKTAPTLVCHYIETNQKLDFSILKLAGAKVSGDYLIQAEWAKAYYQRGGKDYVPIIVLTGENSGMASGTGR